MSHPSCPGRNTPTSHVTARPLAVALVGLALAACGARDGGLTPWAFGTSEPMRASTTFVIHEWGLLSYPLADTAERGQDGLGGAGPFVEVRSETPPSEPPVAYKPVIYAHVDPGSEQRFSIDVDAARFLESWPPGTGSGGRLGWRDVVARGVTSCGPFRYPALTDEACRTRDGYCESANAAHYESRDGACLVVGEAEHDHLLYRAEVRRDAIPVDVVFEDGALRLVLRPGSEGLRLFRVSVDREAHTARAVAFDATTAGAEGVIPAALDGLTRSVADELFSGAARAGLTEAEQATFRQAWEEAIFGASGTQDPFALPRRWMLERRARPTSDALYYWLDPALVERLLPMRVEPAPTSLRRAFLVRVALGTLPGEGDGLPIPDVVAQIERGREVLSEASAEALRREVASAGHQCAGDLLRVGDLELARFTLEVTARVRADGGVDELRVEPGEPPPLAVCVRTRPLDVRTVELREGSTGGEVTLTLRIDTSPERREPPALR